jgi:hypothetical protein
MSSLLNNASLLFNPAGSIISYQEDKIYSVLPKNGTGDFTFTGGDGGTRVNQDGYIEITPFNWFNYSNALNTSPWSMNVTGGQTGKDGTANAWLLTKAGASTSDYYTVKPNDGVQTVSFYVKKESSKGIKPFAIGGVFLQATINIETGVVISKSSGVEVVVEAYNSSWWRIHVTANVVNSFWYWYVTDAAGTQIASTVTLQDMQLVYGNFIKPYQPTTDRLNYPRITYQNGRGALLQEPQRTNLATYSEDLTNGVWIKDNTSITANDTISPDGTQNADRVTRSSTTSTFFYNTNTFSNLNRANSMFFKKGTIDQVTLLGNSYSSGTYATFNLSNGTIISSTGCTPFIEQYKDGWYRCGFVQTNGVNYFLIATLNGYNNDTVTSGEYLYAWGGQCELGEFPTTYIPTTSATVTRPLDQFFNNDSPALNTTNWTFYMSGVNIGKNQNSSGNNIDTVNWSFDSGGGPYGPNSLHNYSNVVYYYDTVNGAASLGDIGSTTTKFAVTKNGTTFKLFRNGVLATTNTLSLASNVWDSFRMYGLTDAQGQAFSNNPSTLAILPSALSDSDAQTLTTVRSGSGGNISYYGPYTIHTFTGSATFTPSFNGQVEVLVVAGGGGGGVDRAGAGGAGGLLYVSSYGVSANTGITVTIGAGGAGTSQNVVGINGSNSVFGGLTAIGGGGGGTGNGAAGRDGGSGGGGGNTFPGTTPGGLGIPGQGNNGGSGTYTGPNYGAGGGGGAGALGANGTNVSSGNGGDGLPYSISGFATYYAGGGGAGSYGGGINGVGGLGGGGNGFQSAANSGVNYTGGGGGSAGNIISQGGTGGSGIVIVRYLT